MFIFDFMTIFAAGTLAGWILELIYRTLFSQKKLVNPGFLSGPYLPIYGFGFIFLYLLSIPDIPLYLRIPLFLAGTTILELITGEFFLRFFNLRLWDYTNRRLNYKGLICPRFTVYWTILSLLFYYIIYPKLIILITLITGNGYSYWGIGFYYGLFVEDVVVSFHLASKLKKIITDAAEKERERLHIKFRELSLDQKTIDFRLFKQQVRRRVKVLRDQNILTRYFNPFMNSRHIDLKENIENYFEKMREIREKRKNRSKT